MKKATIFLFTILITFFLIPKEAISLDGMPPLAFGVHIGAYRSNLDYWENRFIKYGQDKEFGMKLLYGGNFRFGITENVIGRADFAYWTGKVELKNISIVGYIGDETTTISIIPITLSAMYYVPLMKFIAPYMGVGGGFYRVSSKIERTTLIGWNPPAYSNGAFGFGTHLLGGLEIGPFKGISLTAEYRYVFGQVSNRRLNDRGVVEKGQVSLSGPQIFFSLNYAIGDLLRSRAAAVPAYVPPVEVSPREAEKVFRGTESELERIRRERQKAEKELEELRKLLEESAGE